MKLIDYLSTNLYNYSGQSSLTSTTTSSNSNSQYLLRVYYVPGIGLSSLQGIFIKAKLLLAVLFWQCYFPHFGGEESEVREISQFA